MQKYKNIIGTLAFIAGLCILLFVTSLLFAPHVNGKLTVSGDPTANAIVDEPENTIDVLILGDSESYSAFVPLKIWEDFGITSYCCGTPGQDLGYANNFLRKAFQKHSPKVVILETDEIFVKVGAGDSILRNARTAFSIVENHDRWKTFLGDKPDDFTKIENTKGYRFGVNFSEADTSKYMLPTDHCESIPKGNIEYITKMKNYCAENGAVLIFVSTPSTKNWSMARHNSVAKISEELKIDFIDMNLLTEEVPIDWKYDTRDGGDHLNHFGAVKVSIYLGQYLTDRNLAPNHKGEERFAHWDAQTENFNKIITPSLQR